MKKGLHQKIEETLNSLDGVGRAEASPYLYGKIRSRMQEAASFMPQGLAWRMVAALVLVALMNVLTLRRAKTDGGIDSGAQSVASEYSIALPQTY